MTCPYKILVLDDEQLVRDSICAWLEDDGFVVYAAENRSDAMRILDTMPVDIALVDMTLRDMNGADFLAGVLPRYKGVRFVVHTGAHWYRIPPELLELGMREDDIIFKPFLDLEKLSGLLVSKIIRAPGHE